MQKKLTVLFAFAIFVLVVGWAITPVQADPPRPTHNHGGGGSDTGFEPATLDMEFGMVTDSLQGGVGVDSPKKIGFLNANFVDIDPEIHVQFGDNIVCDRANEDTTDTDITDSKDELNNAIITTGFIQVEVDRKKETGNFTIEYISDGNDLGIPKGGARILMGCCGNPARAIDEEVEDPDGTITNTFVFEGPVSLRQLSGQGSRDAVVRCTGPNGVDLTVGMTIIRD